jgi:hypothetical protein
MTFQDHRRVSVSVFMVKIAASEHLKSVTACNLTEFACGAPLPFTNSLKGLR